MVSGYLGEIKPFSELKGYNVHKVYKVKKLF